jgi:hypothetical protein
MLATNVIVIVFVVRQDNNKNDGLPITKQCDDFADMYIGSLNFTK